MSIVIDPIKAQELAIAQLKVNRHVAYTSESDPIFFKAQRGETTQNEWLDKVAEIKARYPYPVE